MKPLNVIVVMCLVAVGAYAVSVALENQRQTRQTMAEIDALLDRDIEAEAPAPIPEVELTEWNWRREHGHVIVEGIAKNLTDGRLNDIMAVATFRTEDGDLVTTSDALLDFNPVLPGQSSPFTVITTENPAMHTASVQFRGLLGETVRTVRPE